MANLELSPLYREVSGPPQEALGKPRDNCAIVGVFSRKNNVAEIAFNGLVELNHRGQEGSGITVHDGKIFKTVKDFGLVGVVFGVKNSLPELDNAHVAVGNDRYSTSGSIFETQPFEEDGISIAHNGNITNIESLRKKYNIPEEIDGARSDTRIALAVINKMRGSPTERILKGIKEFEGAFNLVFATEGNLIVTRDPWGFRPLSLGKINGGNGYVVASENSAFTSMQAEMVRDVLPGETIIINDEGVKTIGMNPKELSRCIFELIYVSRPDSVIFGKPVMEFRLKAGEILARHMPKDIDIIMPVPRSGISAAIGVANSKEAKEGNISYMEGLYTNPYRGVVDGQRTFIMPNGRDRAATAKYSAYNYVVRGKNLVVVDDSILRGSLRFVVQKLRAAGAKTVHALIASPEIKHACSFGIDFGKEELLANKIPDVEKRGKALDLDSLYHLSYAELIEAATGNKAEINSETLFAENHYCGGCFTGKYPVSTNGVIAKS